MAPDAFPRVAFIEGVRISIVPLSVEIIRHINDVINDFSDTINRESLQVLKRS